MPPRHLAVGEPAPWFVARSSVNPAYYFDTVAGRYVVLSFFGSAATPVGRQWIAGFARRPELFDGTNAAFFGVSVDPADDETGRLRVTMPAFYYLWDFDLAVSRRFGAGDVSGDRRIFTPVTYVLDPRLRVLAVFPADDRPDTHAARVIDFLTHQPPVGPEAPAAGQAPVLIVPRVFEPELCRALIRYYEDRGGDDSGFMRDVDGKTVGIVDYTHKRRRDQEIQDPDLRTKCMHRVHDRLIPEIQKAFQFRATRMERYIVACYEAETGGHFRPHRDNTTKGTAHRQFAVSLILNTGDFEGGQLKFPEFGQHVYTAPAGGAVVFSCSLLHEATPVTRGKRYVFLPFLYDDAAARIREENLKFVAAADRA